MARVRVDRQHLPTAFARAGSRSVPSGLEATFVEAVLCNVTNTTQTCEIRFVPSGIAEGSANQDTNTGGQQYAVVKLRSANALQPGETRIYSFQPFLDGGSYILWKAANANAVTGSLAILEEASG